MKARGRRPSAFILSRCLDTPVKHDARVFDMASKTIHTSLVIRRYCFSALISHESMYFKNNQKLILLLFVVSHVVVKMAASFATKAVLKCNRYEERRSEGFSFLNASCSRIVM